MIFSNLFVEQLKRISSESYKIKSDDDLRVLTKKMNAINDSISMQQVRDFLENQIEQSKNRLRKLGALILEDYDKIEVYIKSRNNISKLKKMVDKNGAYIDQYGFPILKKESLISAYRELIIEDIINKLPENAVARGFQRGAHEKNFNQNGTTIKVSFQLGKFEEEEIEKFFRTPNVLSWSDEKSKHDRLVEAANDIRYIKKFSNGLGETVDIPRLKLSIQRYLQDILYLIEAEKALRSFFIETIEYDYQYTEQPEYYRIMITINGERPISFEGYRAYNFHILLSKKISEIDVFKFTPYYASKTHGHKNRYLHTEFEYINAEVAKGWHQYGFIFGLNDLILIPSKGDPCQHSYRPNPEIKNFISKK